MVNKYDNEGLLRRMTVEFPFENQKEYLMVEVLYDQKKKEYKTTIDGHFTYESEEQLNDFIEQTKFHFNKALSNDQVI